MERILQRLRDAYRQAQKQNGKGQVLQEIIVNRKTGEFRFLFKKQAAVTKD